VSIDTTFKPSGPLTFVGAVAVQVVTKDGSGHVSYRVRNIATAAQYFTWGQTAAVTAAAAPTAGVVAPNTIGMLGNSVETFEIPAGVFFIANSATGFEFTSGQGS
jgi:hypothetical protein